MAFLLGRQIGTNENLRAPGNLKRRLRAGSDSTFMTKKQVRESSEENVAPKQFVKPKRPRAALGDRSNIDEPPTHVENAPLVARYQGAPGAFNKRGSYIQPVLQEDHQWALKDDRAPNRKRTLSSKNENSPVPFKKPALLPSNPNIAVLKRQLGVSNIKAHPPVQFRRRHSEIRSPPERQTRRSLRPSSVSVFLDDQMMIPEEDELFVQDKAEDIVFLKAVHVKVKIAEIDILISQSDPLFQRDYAKDMLDYMRKREVALMPVGEIVNAGIKRLARLKVVDWMTQVQHFLKLQQNTLYLAVNILDRYIRIQYINLSRVQLLSITSLLIASKLNERYPCEIEKLIYLTENSYVFKDVVTLEEDILQKLDFCLTCADPDFFIERFLSVAVRKMILNQTDYLLCLTRFYLDCNLPYDIWTTTLPSKLAAGATCLVAKVTSQYAWDEPMVEVSEYSELDLALVMQKMAVHIIQCHRTEFQGAFIKHRSGDYNKLAQDLSICSESKVLQAIAGVIPEGLADHSFTGPEE